MSRSIRTTMIVIIGTVIVLIQAALVFLVARANYQETIAARVHEMELMTATLAKSAADFGTQQMELVRGAATMPLLRDALVSGQDRQGAADAIAALSLASNDINTFYLFDRQGMQVVNMSQGKSAKLSPLADREYVQAALAGKEGYSSTPTRSPATGKLIVSVTFPIRDASGAVAGGVGMSYVLEGFIGQYIDATRLGETGCPFILSPKGVVVGDTDRNLLLTDVSAEPGMRALLAAPQGSGSLERDGRTRRVVWTRVPNWQWVMAFAMDAGEMEAPAKAQRNFMLLAGLVAVVALIGVSLLALDRIAVRPLVRLTRYASEVAAGHLDASLSLRRGNEIGRLADSLRTMVESLKAKIAEADAETRLASEEAARAAAAGREAEEARAAAERARADGLLQAADKLEGVVGVVDAASQELSDQIEHSSAGADKQSMRVAETAAAMEEMTATVVEVARNASQAAESAAHAKGKAEDGASIVSQVIRGIGEAQTQALELKTDMTRLGHQAEGIGQILNVISDIADQTNLLALNAAIEAARAGDAGRGFAVVADEVRKLAEKTMTATKEVGDAIRGIQEGTRRNVDHVEQAVGKIESATDLAGKSGAALKEIVELVEHTSGQVRSIATAAEEQSAVCEQITRSIEDIRSISSETSEGMRQSAQAMAALSDQTHALRGLVRGLKEEGGAADGEPPSLPAGGPAALPGRRR